jgi:AraC-like DNA-binding protein
VAISKRINKWLKGFQKYLFFYRDGFFELPYLSNSPEAMVESLKGMAVTKHNPLEQSIYSNNPFTNGVLRYRELEEGLWILVTQIAFKANVHSRALYDDEPCDYYFLNFSVYQSDIPLQNMTINKVAFKSKSWSLYRPGTEVDAYHYKGTSGLFFNFVFNKQWVKKNLSPDSKSEEDHMTKLLHSEQGLIYWDEVVPKGDELALAIWKILEKENDGHFDTITLKIQTLGVITEFFKNAFKKKLSEQTIVVSAAERRQVSHAEKIIRENLSTGFPGIDEIARKVHMSPTKLKITFKATYGTSLLQYYNEKRMVMAMQLLKDSTIPIKNIALSAGYESPGKFSAAFKKQFGMLPSEVRNP